MIAFEAHAEGMVLPVRAQPGARVSALRGEQNGLLKVSVTQAPEKGKANKAIAVLLSKQLGLRRSQVTLLSGETSQQKKFLIRDISLHQLQQRIEELLSKD